jgi:hypothetical protein
MSSLAVARTGKSLMYQAVGTSDPGPGIRSTTGSQFPRGHRHRRQLCDVRRQTEIGGEHRVRRCPQETPSDSLERDGAHVDEIVARPRVEMDCKPAVDAGRRLLERPVGRHRRRYRRAWDGDPRVSRDASADGLRTGLGDQLARCRSQQAVRRIRGPYFGAWGEPSTWAVVGRPGQSIACDRQPSRRRRWSRGGGDARFVHT